MPLNYKQGLADAIEARAKQSLKLSVVNATGP